MEVPPPEGRLRMTIDELMIESARKYAVHTKKTLVLVPATQAPPNTRMGGQ